MRYFLGTLPALLASGFAGALHCSGMCGGLAMLATGSLRAGRVFAFLGGKAGAYAVLGALAGVAGDVILEAMPFDAGGRILAILAGALLFVAGLDGLGVIRLGAPGFGGAALARILARLGGAGVTGPLVIGAVSGLMPCRMMGGFLAAAAATGSAVWGAATLAALALSNAAPLVILGVLGNRLGRLRTFPVRSLAGALMLATAVVTVFRGLSLAM